MVFVILHGIEYVSWPRLNPLTDIIYYNGPGFRSARHGMGIGAKEQPSWKQGKLLGSGVKWSKVAVEEVELGTMKKRVD